MVIISTFPTAPPAPPAPPTHPASPAPPALPASSASPSLSPPASISPAPPKSIYCWKVTKYSPANFSMAQFLKQCQKLFHGNTQ